MKSSVVLPIYIIFSIICIFFASMPVATSSIQKCSSLEKNALYVRGGDSSSKKQALSVKSEVVTTKVEKKYLGHLSILGGALCHLVLGSTYCWGNFSPYTPLNLRYFGNSELGPQPDTLWVLPGSFIAQMFTMPLGPWLQKKIGCRATALVGCWLMASGVFLSSYAKTLSVFILCYSFMFGAGVGLAYTAPMVNGWKWFPEKKGLVSGAIVAGFGSGGFIFNQVGSRFVNPKGVSMVNELYPSAIYKAFPTMLRKLSLIYFVLTGLGSLLIIQPPPLSPAVSSASAVSVPSGVSLKEALHTRTFWMLWIMALLSGTAGINVVGIYKRFGSRLHSDDKFQSLVGSLGALANGSGRLFWGNTLDSFGFKRPFATLASLQAILMAVYSTVGRSRLGFALTTCGILFCLGGNFAMFPAVTTKIFGGREGAAIYGVLFSAFGIASVSGTFITKALLQNFGWKGVFRTMSFLSLIVLAILSMFESTIVA